MVSERRAAGGTIPWHNRAERRREIPNTCIELQAKGADLVVFLRDANEEDWHAVLRAEENRCRAEHRHLALFGVCARNAECWLAADAAWLAAQTGRQPDEFRVQDPKGVFQAALGISRADKKEEEIAKLVERAPLQHWLGNPSFSHFYDALRQKSKELQCPTMENLRERNL